MLRRQTLHPLSTADLGNTAARAPAEGLQLRAKLWQPRSVKASVSPGSRCALSDMSRAQHGNYGCIMQTMRTQVSAPEQTCLQPPSGLCLVARAACSRQGIALMH